MKTKITFAILALLNIYFFSAAQTKISGTVYELNHQNKKTTLPGATLHWLGTTSGTSTNSEGKFTLNRIQNVNKLVVQHVSYPTDTLVISETIDSISILLTGGRVLNEVTIRSTEGMLFSVKPIAAQIITIDGLRKAACCNLAESFEQTASVDMEYSDAVSGAKHIQMLGLAGIYTQIMLENVPLIRGLSSPFGFGFVPGSWMESIQVSKGTSSVINGYESITGQINVEYKKPENNTEKVFLNLYGDHMGKGELNFNTVKSINEDVHTMLFIHAGKQFMMNDNNNDGFMDVPLSNQVNVLNRWDYDIPNKLEGKTSISYVWENREGGEMNFNHKTDHMTTNHYGFGTDNKRINLTAKNGFFFKKDGRSIGTIVSLTHHEATSFFGLRTYDAIQNSAYLNLIYEEYLGSTKKHKINFGGSFQYDNYNNVLNDSSFDNIESVPGIFAQYTFNYNDKFVAIAGFRSDFYNNEHVFLTPRLHFKWAITSHLSMRGTAGKGYRTPQIYAEQIAIMASSRKFVFLEKIKPEEAWNAGLNLTTTFEMNKKDASIALDFYRTEFINQAIIDLDQNPGFAYIYNLDGFSYSNSTQIESVLYPLKDFELILAYRFNDVRQTIGNSLKEKPMTSQHKALINIGYATKFEKWKFDFTAQWHGSMRLPETSLNPVEYQLSERSPDYFLFNTQITRKTKHIDYYAGIENIGDFKQKNPIISANNPFGSYFDSSIIWGPIKGRMFFAGIRYTLHNK